ncbi:hypothetical protein [Nonomuraea sp. NPDC048826]|uniref:hypothetical protein n=1 Tax=Nonomuraea sp. NPDC048826 TaxID=3364347 RepID=UPI003714CAD4
MPRRSLGPLIAALSVLGASVLVAPPSLADSARLEIPPKEVTVTAANSSDITRTAQGARLLDTFAQRLRSPGVPADFREQRDPTDDYRVLSVDVRKALPDPRCERETETVILPRTVTGIRYLKGSPDPRENSDPCLVTVKWDDDVALNVQDDAGGGQRSAAEKAAASLEEYGSYCASRTYKSGRWYMWCHKKFVLKNDGNSTWNYYGIESWNSCQATQKGRDVSRFLTSCGRGQEVSRGSSSWVDYSPDQGNTTGACRSIDLSLSVGWVGIGGSYNHCEEQRVYLYSDGGKMSSYWKGKSEYLRTTRHRASIKVPQAQGRPRWSHWSNSQAVVCLFVCTPA